MSSITPLIALTALIAAPAAQDGAPAEAVPAVVWDARAAEHLFNRAGFGATPEEVEAAVADGLEATLDRLFTSSEHTPYPVEKLTIRDGVALDGSRISPSTKRPDRDSLTEEERDAVQQRIRDQLRSDRNQLHDFIGWWLGEMVRGADPLRERMTLFWHGHFTSEQRVVRSSYLMAEQNELFRSHAFGSFGDLLHAVWRDPAMLSYLDGNTNSAEHPNENFARELMELFTLGEGNYTEGDIQEAARAFTGTRYRFGRLNESKRAHDRHRKTVLGVTGTLDGDDVCEILLERPECSRYIAGKLLSYFEGVPTSEARVESYGEFLAENDYDVGPLLRRLFTDPEFYSDAVVGHRVASPVDFLVGAARRLDVEVPPLLLQSGARVLGQSLLDPPNVKGWEGGLSWITTASLMNRGNFAGVLLGEVSVGDFLADEEVDEAMGGDMGDGMMGGDEGAERSPRSGRILGRDLAGLRAFSGSAWTTRLSMRTRARRDGVHTDAELAAWLCDELLAIEPSQETVAEVAEAITAGRAKYGPTSRSLLDDHRRGEAGVRRAAHLVLSLPEAQLH